MRFPAQTWTPPGGTSSSTGCAGTVCMPSQRRSVRARSTGTPAKHSTRPLRARAKQQDIAVAIKDLQVEFARGSERSFVLKGVDLEIKRGTLHMLLGPNGCGKSTLLKVLGGLVSPSAGTFDSEHPTGFVFQNPDHQVVMPTVAADVAFGLGRYDLPEEQVRAAVASALEVVNMSPYMYRATHTLSGGQRQRVAIAGALAENPRILLLDELTTFLDMEDQFGVLEAVKGVTRRRSPVSQAGSSSSSTSTSTSTSNGTGVSNSNQQPSQQEHQQGSTDEQAGGVVGPANSFVLKTAGEQEQTQAPGVTAIWVTHRFEELDYADTVSYLQDGRVAFTGTPAEMRSYLKRLGAPV